MRNPFPRKTGLDAQSVRRIFAAGQFFIAFGGGPRHGHSPTGALRARLADERRVFAGEFRHRIRAFRTSSEEAARAGGLKARQHQTMLAIRASGEPTGPAVGRPAEHLSTQNSAVGLVDRLAERGLVERVKGAADGPQVRASSAGARSHAAPALQGAPRGTAPHRPQAGGCARQSAATGRGRRRTRQSRGALTSSAVALPPRGSAGLGCS